MTTTKKRLPVFAFRMEPAERKRLETLAKADGRSPAAWLRRAINVRWEAAYGEAPTKTR